MEATKTKEVVVLEKKVNAIASDVAGIIISDDESMLKAAEIRKEIKNYAKEVKEEKEKATKPLNEVVKTIKGWFAPIEEKCESAVSGIESKMRVYQIEVDTKNRKIAEEAARKIQEAIENEKLSEKQVEKVIAKAEAKIEAAPVVITKSADFHTRTNRKVRFSSPIGLTKIEIVQLVVGGYLVWDEVKARKDALAGAIIPGAEIYEEQSFV